MRNQSKQKQSMHHWLMLNIPAEYSREGREAAKVFPRSRRKTPTPHFHDPLHRYDRLAAPETCSTGLIRAESTSKARSPGSSRLAYKNGSCPLLERAYRQTVGAAAYSTLGAWFHNWCRPSTRTPPNRSELYPQNGASARLRTLSKRDPSSTLNPWLTVIP